MVHHSRPFNEGMPHQEEVSLQSVHDSGKEHTDVKPSNSSDQSNLLLVANNAEDNQQTVAPAKPSSGQATGEREVGQIKIAEFTKSIIGGKG